MRGALEIQSPSGTRILREIDHLQFRIVHAVEAVAATRVHFEPRMCGTIRINLAQRSANWLLQGTD
jgi:hypothetical protein